MSSQHGYHLSPCGPKDILDLTICSWGFSLPTRALPSIELQSFRVCAPLFIGVLMVSKLSPFSFLPYLYPYGCLDSFSFSPAAVMGSAFPVLFFLSPPLSASKNSSLPSVPSLSPSSPLCTAYLLRSVIQGMHIVELILRSIF